MKNFKYFQKFLVAGIVLISTNISFVQASAQVGESSNNQEFLNNKVCKACLLAKQQEAKHVPGKDKNSKKPGPMGQGR
jgi:hypothetical protein